jgi:hypothetical protein
MAVMQHHLWKENLKDAASTFSDVIQHETPVELDSCTKGTRMPLLGELNGAGKAEYFFDCSSQTCLNVQIVVSAITHFEKEWNI